MRNAVATVLMVSGSISQFSVLAAVIAAGVVGYLELVWRFRPR